MLPKFPVQLGFDPESVPNVKSVWDHPTARVMFLLWRPCHIVGPNYFEETLQLATRIEQTAPRDVDQLIKCKPFDNGYGDYTDNDWRAFCLEAWPFFSGEQSVPYAGKVSGEATVRATNALESR